MLSILIPVYNYDITPLVKELYSQTLDCNIEFEILAYDDGSKSSINIKNNSLNDLSNCFFKELESNIGRSAIRNLLANNSCYEHLLFLDADVIPKHSDFIKNYLLEINNQIIYGGITQTEIAPKKPNNLRWYYTKKRESKKGIHSSNFLIKKSLFKSKPFDESITKYGYEDVLFFDSIVKENISICFTNNPAIHNTNDSANTFIKKSEESIENLIYLINNNKLPKDRIGISKYYYASKKIKLNWVIVHIFSLIKPLLIMNLNSSYPSLFLYDFYRLGYFCLLKHKK